jgi:hypothetical protein
VHAGKRTENTFANVMSECGSSGSMFWPHCQPKLEKRSPKEGCFQPSMPLLNDVPIKNEKSEITIEVTSTINTTRYAFRKQPAPIIATTSSTKSVTLEIVKESQRWLKIHRPSVTLNGAKIPSVNEET